MVVFQQSCHLPGHLKLIQTIGINAHQGIRYQFTIVQLHERPKECHYHDVTSGLLPGLRKLLSFLWRNTTRSASTYLLGIYMSELFMDRIQWYSFYMCTTSNEDYSWGGCLEIVCQMPLRSEVMLAPADFHGVDFKELFKTASVPALRWWLQFKSLVNSASC